MGLRSRLPSRIDSSGTGLTLQSQAVLLGDGTGRLLEAGSLHAEHHRVDEHGVAEAERAPIDDPRSEDHAIGIEDGGVLSPLRDLVLT